MEALEDIEQQRERFVLITFGGTKDAYEDDTLRCWDIVSENLGKGTPRTSKIH